ncbi:MAG: hypothetical protein JRG74_05495 [Deltaproteobacteria bacterium]|nr:hypothetical protein [Deltaproteobacteria bacterium]
MDKHDRPNSSDIFWFVKRPVCHKKYIIRSLPAIALPYKQDAPLKMLVLRRGGRVSNPKNIEIESF